MTLEQIRKFCLGLPGATEGLQWGDNLLFRVGGKMFAMADLAPGGSSGYRLSFKCTAERAAELLETPGTAPAPYLAKHSWIALESFDTLPRGELEEALAGSYALVVEKLPKAQKPQPPPGLGAASGKQRRPRSAPRGAGGRRPSGSGAGRQRRGG